MAENPETSIQPLLHSLTVVPEVRWYHLADSSSAALDELATHFGIHPLQIEDCRHRRQTARLEEHDHCTFVVSKALVPPREGNRHLRPNSATGASGEAQHFGEARSSAPTPTPGAAVPGAARAHFEDFDIFLGPDYILTVDEGECSLIPAVARRVSAPDGGSTLSPRAPAPGLVPRSNMAAGQSGFSCGHGQGAEKAMELDAAEETSDARASYIEVSEGYEVRREP